MINYGILVCVACGGVHRNFGSTVRSIQLDWWDIPQIQILLAIGKNQDRKTWDSLISRVLIHLTLNRQFHFQ